MPASKTNPTPREPQPDLLDELIDFRYRVGYPLSLLLLAAILVRAAFVDWLGTGNPATGLALLFVLLYTAFIIWAIAKDSSKK